jgi:transposase
VEIQQLGYTGCYTHLARFVACWRRTWTENASRPEPVVAAPRPLPCDPASGRRISPQIAAALCIKPRGQLTERQVAAVDTLKAEVSGFTAMRQLAMRFRGMLRGRDAGGLERWLKDAQDSGIYAMQRFVRTLRSDLDAVRNAVTEPWSNGVTEGQISRLKTLKRAMYGRAGCELLRARMLPL